MGIELTEVTGIVGRGRLTAGSNLRHLLALFSLYYARLQLGSDYSSLSSGLLHLPKNFSVRFYCLLCASIYVLYCCRRLYGKVVFGSSEADFSDFSSHPPTVWVWISRSPQQPTLAGPQTNPTPRSCHFPSCRQ